MANKNNVIVTLPFPIAVEGGDPISEVTLKEPKAGDLRGLKFSEVMETDVDSMMAIIPRISPLTIRQLENLKMTNMLPLVEGVIGFFVEDESLKPATE